MVGLGTVEIWGIRICFALNSVMITTVPAGWWSVYDEIGVVKSKMTTRLPVSRKRC